MLSPTIFVATLLPVVYLLNRVRYWRFKQYADWPQLQTSLIWGHAKAMYGFIKSGAHDRHPDIIFSEIQEKLGHPPAFVMDFRPFSFALCIVCNHEVAEQVSRGSKKFPYSMTKAPNPYVHLLGPNSILTHEVSGFHKTSFAITDFDGEEWKSLRKRFNPGFAPRHLINFLPCILEKTWHFLAHLDGHARTGEVFNLDELCINLTFDIIGTVTMDVDLDAQLGKKRQSEIIRIFRELDSTYRDYNGGSAFYWANPFTAWHQRSLSNKLSALLKERVVERFTEQKHEAQSEQSTADQLTRKKSLSILSLSLQDVDDLTPSALDSTCDQLKSFLSAGHDTTSILLQWIFYELGRTPRVHQAICAELDEIFGPDSGPGIVRDLLLSHGEDVLGKMSYTSAVIKEILRLYPPAATARRTALGAGYNVHFADGRELCMDGLIVYNCETIIHRDQEVYGETKDDFIPERWLGDTDTSMQTNVDEKEREEKEKEKEKEKADVVHNASLRGPRSAWRPFERGPRNCIGQELANLEVRVILACTVRRYNFTKVGLGELARDKNGEAILNVKGQYEVKSRLYNKRQVTAKPADGTRMRVELNPKASMSLQ